MSPNHEPTWVTKEPVSTADAEFKEAIKASPFAGAVAVEALAKFIKATDTVRSVSSSSVSTEAATEQIMNRTTEARDAALAASDATYAQIFDAQLQGWEAATRNLQSEPAPQEQPTQTDAKSMSSGKSEP